MKNNPVCAVELFSAAWCNLDCKYCYIPKHDDNLLLKHKEIIKEVKEVAPLIERIKKVVNTEQLEAFSHWGTEPSLTLHYFKNFYKKALKEFPNLKEVNLSSNFIQNTDKVVDFISTFPVDRKFNFKIQLSLDGPDWITVPNRRGATTKTITDNICYFIENLNKEKLFHTVVTQFKPTINRHDYKRFLEDNVLFEYFKFFDDLIDNMVTLNKLNNIRIYPDCGPTIVCPDDYTKEDGKIYYEVYKKMMDLKEYAKFKHITCHTQETAMIKRLDLCFDELFTKQRMFTCSAGDSCVGISEYLHPCHETFYHPYDWYEKSLYKDLDRIGSEKEIEMVKLGTLEESKKSLILKIDNITEEDLYFYHYKYRAFHDFAKHKLSYLMFLIKEMAECGQIDDYYKDDEMAFCFGLTLLLMHQCPAQNMWNGSMQLTNLNYIKLYGNGWMNEMIKEYIKNRQKEVNGE